MKIRDSEGHGTAAATWMGPSERTRRGAPDPFPGRRRRGRRSRAIWERVVLALPGSSRKPKIFEND